MTRLCRLYGVTRAGYYAWRARPVSARAEQDRVLSRRLAALFGAHHGRYGSPRLHRELADEGRHVSRRPVERLMRAQGLRARVTRVYRARPGLRRFLTQHPNRLPPAGAPRPDQVWVGDVTYVRVAGRWWFLGVVLDRCSRRGLVFHSDRGPEYLAAAFGDRRRARGVPQSSAWRGPEDNAHMESFLHSLKAELLHGRRFTSADQLRRALARSVRYSNHHRRHSALAYRTPVDYEQRVA